MNVGNNVLKPRPTQPVRPRTRGCSGSGRLLDHISNDIGMFWILILIILWLLNESILAFNCQFFLNVVVDQLDLDDDEDVGHAQDHTMENLNQAGNNDRESDEDDEDGLELTWVCKSIIFCWLCLQLTSVCKSIIFCWLCSELTWVCKSVIFWFPTMFRTYYILTF